MIKLKINVEVILLLLIALSGCSVYKSSDNSNHKNENQIKELEYYYAFTEATKQALFSNYNDAIRLYRECIKFNPQSSASYYQISNIMMRIGAIGSAKEYALKASNIDHGNKWYLYHLASLYQMTNNLDSTIIIYRKIVELDSTYENRLNLAFLYNQNNDFKKALIIVDKLQNEFGTSERILFFKHELYKNLKMKSHAIEILIDGAKLYPDNIDFKGLLAEYYASISKPEMAEHIYQSILFEDTDDLRIMLSYGDFLIMNKKFSEANKIYLKLFNDSSISVDKKVEILSNFVKSAKGLEMSGIEIGRYIGYLDNLAYNDLKVRYLSADINLSLGDYNAVTSDIKYILKYKSDDSKIWERLIYLENLLGNADSVIYYADLALHKFNNEELFFTLKGLALSQKNLNKAAITCYKNGIEFTSNNKRKAQIYGFIAESFRNLGIDDSSDLYFELSIKLDKENLILKNNYSYYLALRSENLKRAELLSRETISSEPDNSTFLDTYAWILYKLGLTDKAKKYIEKAVKNDNNGNAEILDHYGDIIYSEGDKKGAIRIWERALQLEGSNSVGIKDKIQDAKDKLRD